MAKQVKKEKEKRVTENADYIAFLQRGIRGLEARAIDDPSILAEVIMLAQRLAEIPNVVIATSAARYSNDPYSSPSANEISAVLGMSPQAVSQRRKIGDRTLFERQVGEETIPQRERIARTLARKYAEDTMAAWLQRKGVNA